MEELVKRLEGHTRKEAEGSELPREINGILTFHAKYLEFVNEEDPSLPEVLQLKIHACGHTKSFLLETELTDDRLHVISDDIKHIPITLQKMSGGVQSSVARIVAEVPSVLLPGTGSTLGQAKLHLQDLISDSPLFGGKIELKDESNITVFAFLHMDIAFNYGRLGFGESFQLPHSTYKPEYFLRHSLFPRILPTEHHVDELTVVPLHTKHPKFIPFNKQATLCAQESMEIPAHAQSPQATWEMPRLKKLRKEFNAIQDRKQKLKFLKNVVLESSSSSVGSDGVTIRHSLYPQK